MGQVVVAGGDKEVVSADDLDAVLSDLLPVPPSRRGTDHAAPVAQKGRRTARVVMSLDERVVELVEIRNEERRGDMCGIGARGEAREGTLEAERYRGFATPWWVRMRGLARPSDT